MQNLFSNNNMCPKSVNELPRNDKSPPSHGRKREEENDTKQKQSLTSWKY